MQSRLTPLLFSEHNAERAARAHVPVPVRDAAAADLLRPPHLLRHHGQGLRRHHGRVRFQDLAGGVKQRRLI